MTSSFPKKKWSRSEPSYWPVNMRLFLKQRLEPHGHSHCGSASGRYSERSDTETTIIRTRSIRKPTTPVATLQNAKKELADSPKPTAARPRTALTEATDMKNVAAPRFTRSRKTDAKMYKALRSSCKPPFA